MEVELLLAMFEVLKKWEDRLETQKIDHMSSSVPKALKFNKTQTIHVLGGVLESP